MKKTPTLLVRDPQDRRHVIDQVTPGCEWVLAGEGIPTRKWDGTCVCLDSAGSWWARREVKPGKTPPPGWIPIDADEVTGTRIGWQPIADSPFARWHAEAVTSHSRWEPGTYELCGPKINGNPEHLASHMLLLHGAIPIPELAGPQTIASIVDTVTKLGFTLQYEGVVWHHPDRRKAKLKARDLHT